jgi:uncharacterized protein
MATVRYTRGGDTFEWDSEKAAENLRKHDISFELACEVFADPFLLFTDASVPEEPRDAVIGYTTTHQLLFVVHVCGSFRHAGPRPRSDGSTRKTDDF